MKWVQVGVGVEVVVITGVVGTGDSWVYSRLYPRPEQEVAVTRVIPSMVVEAWQGYDCGISISSEKSEGWINVKGLGKKKRGRHTSPTP
jgi:hypothetical protein